MLRRLRGWRRPFGAAHGYAEDTPDAVLLGATTNVADAIDVFYRRHHAYLLTVLARRTGDLAVALDLASEVMAAAYLGRHSYDPDRGPARGWLLGIAHHKLAAHARDGDDETRARRALGIHLGRPSAKVIGEVEALVAATEAVEDLPPFERDAVWVRLVEERGYVDMARQASDSPPAVSRTHLVATFVRRAVRGRS